MAAEASQKAADAMHKAAESMSVVTDSLLPMSKTRARHSPVSFFLGTLMGNFVTLIFFSLFLVLLGALAWLAAGCGTDMTCGDYPAEFWPAFWLSWGLHFDPGTQTGIASTGERASAS